MKQYHAALTNELDSFHKMQGHKSQLDTIYFGGGTPSTYPDDLLLDMFVKLKGKFDICDNTEVSIEVNPGTVSREQLAFWKDIGINRLSIGVQSLNDSVLKKLNRLQTADDVRRLLGYAVHFFDTISVDLILGLPGVTEDEWKALLEEVVAWPLKHISIYFLTVHENTRLYFQIKQNKIVLPTDEYVIDSYHWSVNFLKENGFDRYETSNFAKPGYKCKHNLAYWKRKPYKGFGLGACSFDGTMRFQNKKNLADYLQAVCNEEDCSESVETLTKEQVRLEKIMLGLRRSCGISIEFLYKNLSEDKKGRLRETIGMLKLSGYVQRNDNNLVLTPKGFVLQNDIAVRLSL